MTTPEQRARQTIDRLLEAAGWRVQDRRDLNLGAGLGVAVREFPLSTGPADYLLFVERKAIGVVEAKPEGTTLSGVEFSELCNVQHMQSNRRRRHSGPYVGDAILD